MQIGLPLLWVVGIGVWANRGGNEQVCVVEQHTLHDARKMQGAGSIRALEILRRDQAISRTAAVAAGAGGWMQDTNVRSR